MEDIIKKDFKSILYGEIMPKVYGIGASIVIIGAMFKILNWTGANLMIGAGLTTEAMIFFLSAFEPKSKDCDWTKVYPQLDPDYEGPISSKATPSSINNKAYDKEITELAKTLKSLNAAYSQEVKSLNFRLEANNKLFSNEEKTLTEMQKASKEAEAFRVELEKLREKISTLNAIYDKTLNALKR